MSALQIAPKSMPLHSTVFPSRRFQLPWVWLLGITVQKNDGHLILRDLPAGCECEAGQEGETNCLPFDGKYPLFPSATRRQMPFLPICCGLIRNNFRVSCWATQYLMLARYPTCPYYREKTEDGGGSREIRQHEALGSEAVVLTGSGLDEQPLQPW